jgi:hypothetical protein
MGQDVDRGKSRVLVHMILIASEEEGRNASCYPRWATSKTFPLSSYRVIRAGVLSSFRLESASGPETHPKIYMRVIRVVLNPFDGVQGLPTMGYRHESLPGV